VSGLASAWQRLSLLSFLVTLSPPDSPSRFSPFSEHSAPGEKAASTAARGLREELGVFSDDDTMLMLTTCLIEEEYTDKRRSEPSHRVDKQLTHVAFYEQDMR